MVNLEISVVNVASGNSTLLAEVAHLPFVLGLVGAYLVHRADPVFTDAVATAHPAVHV